MLEDGARDVRLRDPRLPGGRQLGHQHRRQEPQDRQALQVGHRQASPPHTPFARIGVATKPKCEKVLQAVDWDLERAASRLLDTL